MRRTVALAVFIAVSCFLAWGQTSIEYGTISSGSATGITRAGGTATSALGEVGKRLSNAVNAPSSSTPAQPLATSADTLTRSNRQQIEKPPVACSMVHISSAPKQATLYVDHLAVAATPADLCLPIGKHILELKSPGFRAWSQDVTVNTGEELTLTPKLSEEKQTKEYKRTVSL